MLKPADDRRAIRTKKMIKISLSELIEEKGFNNISITDLTTRADINRGTFYLHYADKYDLLEKIENEIIQEIQEQTKDIDNINIKSIDDSNEPLPFVIKLFEYFEENSSLIKAILGPKGDPLLQSKLKKVMEVNYFEKKLVKAFKQENMMIPEEYFVSYIISAHLGVVQQWLESGMNKSPKEMALILFKMSMHGPLWAAGLKNNTDRR